MDLTETREVAIRIVAVVSIAIMGGVARIMLDDGKGEKMSPGRIFRELIISGFAGLMVAFLVGDSNISTYMLGFLSGMAGLTAPFTLSFLSRLFKRYLTGKSGIDENAGNDKP